MVGPPTGPAASPATKQYELLVHMAPSKIGSPSLEFAGLAVNMQDCSGVVMP